MSFAIKLDNFVECGQHNEIPLAYPISSGSLLFFSLKTLCFSGAQIKASALSVQVAYL